MGLGATNTSGSRENSPKKHAQVVVEWVMAQLGSILNKERQKIADELHDQLGQNLILAKMKLESLNRLVPKKFSISVEEVRDLIGQTIEDTRSVIQGLCPKVLEDLGLKDALNWLVEQIQSKYTLRCSLKIEAIPQSLNEDIQSFLFQAVRELLMNAAKHARATEVTVICGCEKGLLRIQVVDDGRGFDPQRVTRSGSEFGNFGLFSIRARLAPLGGEMVVDSKCGAGTSVTLVLPIHFD
jgi:signal transduction histidine kinase